MLILWYLVVNVRIKNAKDKQTPQPSQTQKQNTKTTDINKIKQMEYYKTSQFIKHHTCTNMPLRYVCKTYFTIEKYTLSSTSHKFHKHRGGNTSCPYKYAAPDSKTNQNRSVTKMVAFFHVRLKKAS